MCPLWHNFVNQSAVHRARLNKLPSGLGGTRCESSDCRLWGEEKVLRGEVEYVRMYHLGQGGRGKNRAECCPFLGQTLAGAS